MISQKLVEELKIIIKEDYGREVNDKEAFEIANNLADYFDLSAKIYHQIKTQKEKNEKSI